VLDADPNVSGEAAFSTTCAGDIWTVSATQSL